MKTSFYSQTSYNYLIFQNQSCINFQLIAAKTWSSSEFKKQRCQTTLSFNHTEKWNKKP